jgi:hypothetical protein
LGVSLGSSHDQISESISLLKDTDLNRTLIMLKCNEEKTRNEMDEQSNLFLDEVGKLSDDCRRRCSNFGGSQGTSYFAKKKNHLRCVKRNLKRLKLPHVTVLELRNVYYKRMHLE